MPREACGKEQICSPLPTSSLVITQSCSVPPPHQCLDSSSVCGSCSQPSQISRAHSSPHHLPALLNVLANLKWTRQTFMEPSLPLTVLYNSGQNY